MSLAGLAQRQQVERLLRSKSLEGSEVHRRLLEYLAEKSLAGETEHLKEYTIALDALGKPSTYDPRRDSIVRIQIGRLRQKLTEYYPAEGRADPIVVSLPKGSFRLIFENASLAQQIESVRWRRIALSLGLAAVLLGVWAVGVSVRLSQSSAQLARAGGWNAELEEFWRPFVVFRVPSAITWDQLQATSQYAAVEAMHLPKPSMPWYGFTGVGEATSAFLIGKLLGTRRSDLLLTRSNLLSWQEISDSDIVFLGPPKFNVQLSGILEKQEIQIEPKGIRVLNPRPGELAYYGDSFLPGPDFEGVSHALISSTPGLSGQGRLLILAGNASADTTAAAQWLTQPERARQLAAHLRLPSGKLPRSFQIVLKVRFKNGVPIESSYVMHRVIQH
ncbi:MAG: hypothetical protein NTY38_29540 [Acidobacteria bacterium]|nr:hypothetical protein [Acidobacteriota bacterium]